MSPAPSNTHIADGSTKALLVGAMTMLSLTLGSFLLLAYVLVDIPLLLEFGDWTYLVGSALIIGSVIPLRMWRPFEGARVGMSAADASTFDTSQVEKPA